MICVSIGTLDVERCHQILKNVEMAEIRLDRIAASEADIGRIFSSHPRLVATCRPGGMEERQRRGLLLRAIDSGAAYVDLELDAAVDFRRPVIKRARSRGCRVIISHHDFVRTPERSELGRLVRRCFRAGADIAKIACRVLTPRDRAALLGLLSGPGPVVVAGMGRAGRIVRIVAPLLGSPFTYASISDGEPTADGQVSADETRRILETLNNV